MERNPVIYTHSLSMLRMCVLSAQNNDTAGGFKALVTEALPPEEYRPPILFAQTLNTTVFRDAALTKLTFLALAANKNLIHFHRHISFHAELAWEHFLSLRRMEEVAARDIFDIRLKPGVHVTLVGCESGRSGYSASDNLTGLTTAFHYAGASSIISTLWKIMNADGSEFSEAFYGALAEQEPETEVVDGRNIKVLNLAKDMQRAVLKVWKNEDGTLSAPYHWAGFTLHGFWTFPKPEI
jgi:CHAT domain-containing protein